MQNVTLKVSESPIFTRPDILPVDLREPVYHNIDQLVNKEILTSVSPAKVTPIITPMINDERNLRICGDYWVMMKKLLKQTSCSTPEPEDFLHQSHVPNSFVSSSFEMRS